MLFVPRGGLFSVDVEEEGLDGGGDLVVDAEDDLCGVVGYFDIGLKLGVFEVVALGGLEAYDGDAEREGRVLHVNPVDGAHGAGDGHSDYFSKSEVAVNPRCSVGVGVVCFAGEHH